MYIDEGTNKLLKIKSIIIIIASYPYLNKNDCLTVGPNPSWTLDWNNKMISSVFKIPF